MKIQSARVKAKKRQSLLSYQCKRVDYWEKDRRWRMAAFDPEKAVNLLHFPVPCPERRIPQYGAAERAFRHLAEQKEGMTVHRLGWPDFLLRDAKGVTFAVEVKSYGDLLSEDQTKCFEMMEHAKIKVYVWWAASPNKLIPWRKFLSMSGKLRQDYR